MMKRKHLHTLLIMCIALLCAVTVKAGDNKWTLNANQTEWLYTYTTDRYPTTFLVNGYSYNGYAQGKITFSFRNTRVTDRIANAGWADFGMRIGTAGDTDPGSTIPTYQSSGTVQVSLYYANGNYAGDVSYQANAFPHFHYYNSHLEDDGTVKLNDEPVLPYGFWWNLDLQRSIKIFFQRPNGEILETLRIRHPLDEQAKCYSTTEGNVRNYRTNLWNRFDANNRQQNKSVNYMVDRGDGTYLLNPVWDEFFTQNSNGTLIAKNKYKPNALDWTGKVSSTTVVTAPLNPQTQKYELTLGCSMPLNLFKDKDNDKLHSLAQAIVRAETGSIVEMSYKYYDFVDNQIHHTTWDWGCVAGVGIDDKTEGNTAYGTVHPNGRVDFLKRIGNGGWVKLEAPIQLNQASADMTDIEARVWIVLTSDKPFEVSDVFLLWRPDQPGFYQTSANRLQFTKADKDIDESWIDLSAENKFSLFDRGANLNRVVKVNPATTLGHAGHEHPCNVVINGRTPLLYLTDKGVRQTDSNDEHCFVHTGAWLNDNKEQYMKSGYTFGVNEAFTADKVWFDRNFVRRQDANGDYHSMSTICLPFAMDATDLSKFNVSKAYEFMNATGNKATFKEVTATEADKPYLIEPQAAITTAHETPLEFSNKQIPASKIADGDFIGTYQYRNLPAKDGEYTNYIFGFNTQKFNYVKSNGASFKPFRAYLRSKQSTGSKAKSIEFKIWDGSVTGIEQIDTKDNTPSHAPIYTIDGRMVSPTGNLQLLPQGIYIQNGKKIIK